MHSNRHRASDSRVCRVDAAIPLLCRSGETHPEMSHQLFDLPNIYLREVGSLCVPLEIGHLGPGCRTSIRLSFSEATFTFDAQSTDLKFRQEPKVAFWEAMPALRPGYAQAGNRDVPSPDAVPIGEFVDQPGTGDKAKHASLSIPGYRAAVSGGKFP